MQTELDALRLRIAAYKAGVRSLIAAEDRERATIDRLRQYRTQTDSMRRDLREAAQRLERHRQQLLEMLK